MRDLADFKARLIELAHSCDRGADPPAVVATLHSLAEEVQRRADEPEPEVQAPESPPEETSLSAPPEVEGGAITTAELTPPTTPTEAQAQVEAPPPAYADEPARPVGRARGRS